MFTLRGGAMVQVNTLRGMIDQLLELPGYSVARIARQIGVHEETLRKLRAKDSYHLLPAKQLALIKLFCAEKDA